MTTIGHCTGTFSGHSPLCDRDGTYCSLASAHDGPCKPHGRVPMAATIEMYDRAERYARDLGREHGTNAASWVLGTHSTDTECRRVLDGLDDGDPEILDLLPAPDLSGQWADTLTGPDLVNDAADYAGFETDDDGTPLGVTDDFFTAVCDAYEYAYTEAVEAEVYRVARYMLAE